MSAPTGRLAGFIAVFVAVLCFSIGSPLVKWAETPGSAIAAWRMVAAIAVWWMVMAVYRRRTGAPWPSAATWRAVVPAGLFFGANLAVFFTAVGRTSIAHAEFIAAMSPIALVPLGALLFHEHPNWRAMRWAAISLVGIAVVLFAGGDQGAASVEGDLLMVVAISLWIGYLLSTKRARQRGIGTVEFMACVVPIAAVAAFPMAAVIAGDALWPMPARAWLVVGILGILTGVAAHGLLVFAQNHVPVAAIGVIQVAGPALAVLWAYFLLGEEVAPAQIPGMALVIIGLGAFTLASQRRPPAPPVAPDPTGA